jgi:4-amino-4-deoxy-L-arabinose transferase-like glycosyltransferase
MMGRSRWSYVFLLGLLLLVVVSSALRLETVGQRMIWLDETYTDQLARLPSASEVIARSNRDFAGNVPPLHYLLCFLHYRVSDSVASLRMASVESGVLSVLALVAVGCQLFGRRLGLISGALMAFCIYHINYSQDARPYALLVLFVTLSFVCVFGFLASGRWRWLPAFVASAVVSVYSHHFAWIFQACIAVTLLGALVARYAGASAGFPGGRSWKPVLLFSVLAYAALGLSYLPLAPDLIEFFTRRSQAASHTLNPSFPFFWELFGRWGNGSSWSLLYTACFVVGLVAIGRRRDMSLALILWFAAPFLVFALLPSKSRLFDIRYLIGALPAFLLIVALGIDTLVAQGHRLLARAWGAPWLRRVELRNAALAAVMLVILGGSIDTYRTFRVTRVRCSQFYGTQEILERHDGFCRKHLILNSLYPAHAYIWKKHGQRGK